MTTFEFFNMALTQRPDANTLKTPTVASLEMVELQVALMTITKSFNFLFDLGEETTWTP